MPLGLSKPETIGRRDTIGKFFAALEIAIGKSWIKLLSMECPSDQDVEKYRWLTASPAMREWIGGLNARGLTANGIDIENKILKYNGLSFYVEELTEELNGLLS